MFTWQPVKAEQQNYGTEIVELPNWPCVVKEKGTLHATGFRLFLSINLTGRIMYTEKL